MSENNLIEQKEITLSYGRPGSYIGVAERAHYLIVALDAMSQRNSRLGLSTAAFTSPYSGPIWERYQENTEIVLSGAERNQQEYEEIMRVSFWRATGFSALRGSGLMRERQINPRAQKMWTDFKHMYGHPSTTKARNKYKKQLEKSLDSAMKQKEQQLKLNLEAGLNINPAA